MGEVIHCRNAFQGCESQHIFEYGKGGGSPSIPPATMIRLPPRLCNAFATAARRGYAVQAPGAPRLQVFNRHHKWLQKERAAADVDASRRVDYLRDEVAARLCERLLVCHDEQIDLGKHCLTLHRTLIAASTMCSTTGPMHATSAVP